MDEADLAEALDATKTYITDYSLRTRGETNMAKSEIYAPGKSEDKVRESLESAGFPDLPIALEGTVLRHGDDVGNVQVASGQRSDGRRRISGEGGRRQSQQAP